MAKIIIGNKSLSSAEDQVAAFLLDNLSDDYTIIRNVIISGARQNLEIDAIVLGRHRLFVLEIKSFYGNIHGNQQTWLIGDGKNKITNPLSAASFRAHILKSQLIATNPRLKSVPVEYLVFLANTETPKLKIEDDSLEITRIVSYKDVIKFIKETDVSINHEERKIIHLHEEITKIIWGNYVPSEIVNRSKNQEKLLDSYLTQDVAKQPLHESRLIILGQGSVGKSSLLQRVIHNIFNHEITKTEGISIEGWQVKGYELRESDHKSENTIGSPSGTDFFIHLNIWDFGGQEIMHATHQFFLTKRSLYLLVLDSRLTQEENRVEYWLKIIQSFGGESPVLIVGNKIDQHPLDIDRTGLQKKYPNIVGILETSAATGAGIEELKTAITEQVNNLPHVRDLLPETWFTVKTKLEELGNNPISSRKKNTSTCAPKTKSATRPVNAR